jgi:tRNA(Ile)-lysidine synthase
VSGGADSVALLRLLRDRPDLRLQVAHLDHETRGGASTDDARFVADLAARLGLACTVARLCEVELDEASATANRPARYRAARLKLFRRVIDSAKLDGVILAHHADDQAETVFHRLCRGSGPEGMAAMSADTRIGTLRVVRPLLGVDRITLRRYLTSISQDWREDASNSSNQYARNRLRKVLEIRPRLTQDLLEFGAACRDLSNWARTHAPVLPASFACAALATLPPPLARESARRWLISCGASRANLQAPVLARLVNMACDAASPPRQHFPGGILVARRRGIMMRL